MLQMASHRFDPRCVPAAMVACDRYLPKSWLNQARHMARAWSSFDITLILHSVHVRALQARPVQLRQPKLEGWTRFVCFSDAWWKDTCSQSS